MITFTTHYLTAFKTITSSKTPCKSKPGIQLSDVSSSQAEKQQHMDLTPSHNKPSITGTALQKFIEKI
jgi:hypothetical protein